MKVPARSKLQMPQVSILFGLVQAKAHESGKQQDSHDLERLPYQDGGGNAYRDEAGWPHVPTPDRSDNYHNGRPPGSWFTAKSCP